LASLFSGNVRVRGHTLRHAFAIHLIAQGATIRRMQEWPGQTGIQTTPIDTHVLNHDGQGVLSPADNL
jgi:site-specific recombinase XerD